MLPNGHCLFRERGEVGYGVLEVGNTPLCGCWPEVEAQHAYVSPGWNS